jgi:phosphoribosylcarboxyaminoimidazole (NCAIR) mutase
MDKRRIGIMIGSDSDLPQCLRGFQILKEAEERGDAQVVAVFTNSIHRHRKQTFSNLRAITKHTPDQVVWVDRWIIGAGKANQITGMCESELRYVMRNDLVHVIGVAFKGKTRNATLAAILSIAEVPGSQVIFDRKRHVGTKGFANACYDAVYADFPAIKLPVPPPTAVRTLDGAIFAAKEMMKK